MYTRHLSRLVAHILLLCMILILASCAPAATTEPTKTPEPPTATPDPKQALVGSWTSTVTKEDLLRVVPDFPQEYLCDNAGTFVWKFNADGTFTIDQTALPDCPTPANTHIEDTWSIDGNLFTIAKGTANQEIYEWIVEADTLVFVHKFGECVPCMAINTANPWNRVD